jgi:hypothetical protein
MFSHRFFSQCIMSRTWQIFKNCNYKQYQQPPGLSRRRTDKHVRPSVTSDKALVRQIRINVMLTSNRVKPKLLCPWWLPHWILGHYIIGVGTRPAWWGRAWLREGRTRLLEGHARLPEGCTRLPHIESDVMQNHELKKTKILWAKQTIFWEPYPSALGQFQPHGCMYELLKKYMKNELSTCFQQKFATGSYRVGIGRAWCSQKACEICSSLV